MEKYNTHQPIIYNTIQLYRKDGLELLNKFHQRTQQNNVWYAVKFVRGAYLEKERERAQNKGYPSPLHETKRATDKDFNKALQYGIEHLSEIAICAATHNEVSCQQLIRTMEKKQIQRDHERISFCQLYGMGDHITFNLAQAGYNVSKYLPYGPVKKVIPYLIRRAKENSSIAGQMNRELRLLSRERQRRQEEGNAN